MFWQNLGVGSLINLACNLAGRRDTSLIQQQHLVSLREALNDFLYSAQKKAEFETEEDGEDLEAKLELAEAVNNFTFPDESNETVREMQMEFHKAREQMVKELSYQLADLKADFYAEHCLNSRVLPSGISELILDEEGIPECVGGCETPELKILRGKWEAEQRRRLVEKQDEVRDQFTEKLRDEVLNFLRPNRFKLMVEKVYNGLFELLMEARRQALDIVLEQEKERWMLEVPEDEEIRAVALEGLEKLAEFTRQEAQEEADSPAMAEVLNFERELSSYIYKCRWELRRREHENIDFLDPRASMEARKTEYVDFTEALPAHMVSCLSDLGISGEDLA